MKSLSSIYESEQSIKLAKEPPKLAVNQTEENSKEKSLLELYPFTKPDPSRYFTGSSITTPSSSVGVALNSQNKNEKSITLNAKVSDSIPSTPKPLAKDDISGDRIHNKTLASVHHRHPTVSRKYPNRRRRINLQRLPKDIESLENSNSSFHLKTKISSITTRNTTRKRIPVNLRHQRRRRPVKRRRRLPQTRLPLPTGSSSLLPSPIPSLLNSTVSLSSLNEASTKYKQSLTAGDNFDILNHLLPAKSPNSSLFEGLQSNYRELKESKNNSSSESLPLYQSVKQNIPLPSTSSSSNVDSTTVDKKSQNLHHDLQHEGFPSTSTLAPSGETSSHSLLPIPTGGNKFLAGPIPGLPRRDPNDPTGARSTGPHPTQTTLIFPKTFNGNKRIHPKNINNTNIPFLIPFQFNRTLTNILGNHENETLLHNSPINKLIDASKLIQNVYVNSSFVSQFPNISNTFNPKMTDLIAFEETPHMQLASSSLSQSTYLPTFQYKLDDETGEYIPHVQLTFNINVPLQQHLTELLKNRGHISESVQNPKLTALPLSDDNISIRKSEQLTTTIPSHTYRAKSVNAKYNPPNAVVQSHDITSVRTSTDHPNLSLHHRQHFSAHSNPKQLPSKILPTTTSFTNANQPLKITQKPFADSHHEKQINSYTNFRNKRPFMFLHQRLRQRFSPALRRRPIDTLSSFHGPVVRTRYLRPLHHKVGQSFQNIHFGHTPNRGTKEQIDTLSPDDRVKPKVPVLHAVTPLYSSSLQQEKNGNLPYTSPPGSPSIKPPFSGLYDLRHAPAQSTVSSHHSYPSPIRKINGYLPTSSPHFRGNNDNPYFQERNTHHSHSSLHSQNQGPLIHYTKSFKNHHDQHYHLPTSVKPKYTTEIHQQGYKHHTTTTPYSNQQNGHYHLSTTAMPHSPTSQSFSDQYNSKSHHNSQNAQSYTSHYFKPIHSTTKNPQENSYASTAAPNNINDDLYYSTTSNPNYPTSKYAHDDPVITTYHPPHRHFSNRKPYHPSSNDEHQHYKLSGNYQNPSITITTVHSGLSNNNSPERYHSETLHSKIKSSSPVSYSSLKGAKKLPPSYTMNNQAALGNLASTHYYKSGNLDSVISNYHSKAQPSEHNSFGTNSPSLTEAFRATSKPIQNNYSALKAVTKPANQYTLHTNPHQKLHHHHPHQSQHDTSNAGISASFVHFSTPKPGPSNEPVNHHTLHTNPHQKLHHHHPHQSQHDTSNAGISASFVRFSTPKPGPSNVPFSDNNPQTDAIYDKTVHYIGELQDSNLSQDSEGIYNKHHIFPGTVQYSTPINDHEKAIELHSNFPKSPINQNKFHIPLVSNPSVVAVTPRSDYGIQSPYAVHTPIPLQAESIAVSTTEVPVTEIPSQLHSPELKYAYTGLPYSLSTNSIVTLTPKEHLGTYSPDKVYQVESHSPSYPMHPTEVSVQKISLSKDSSHPVQIHEPQKNIGKHSEHEKAIDISNDERVKHEKLHEDKKDLHSHIYDSGISRFPDHLTKSYDEQPDFIEKSRTADEVSNNTGHKNYMHGSLSDESIHTTDQSFSYGNSKIVSITNSSLISTLRGQKASGRRRILKRRKIVTTISPEVEVKDGIFLPYRKRGLAHSSQQLREVVRHNREKKQLAGDLVDVEANPKSKKDLALNHRYRTRGQVTFSDGTNNNDRSRQKGISLLERFPFRSSRRKPSTAAAPSPRSLPLEVLEELPDAYLQKLVDVGFGEKITN